MTCGTHKNCRNCGKNEDLCLCDEAPPDLKAALIADAPTALDLLRQVNDVLEGGALHDKVMYFVWKHRSQP